MIHPQTLPTDTQVVAGFLLNRQKRLMARIVHECAAESGVPAQDIMGRSQKAKVAHARHVAMFLIHRKGHSLSEIGRFFGRDHTTVMAAVRKVEAML